MAQVFSKNRVVEAWLEAARYLSTQANHDSCNIILEIKSPKQINENDRLTIAAVDKALQSINLKRSVMTAAATIFPYRLYNHYKRPEWYSQYKAVIQHSKEKHTWGTYTLRMIERKGKNGENFNPLEAIIQKLSAMKKLKRHYKATCELGITAPEIDLHLNGEGFELPTYNPSIDQNKYLGTPCLSHVTFKLISGKLELTAIYRSHYYAERALGNLIGLAQLQDYVATESGFEVGTMTCISTYAILDSGLGSIKYTRDLLLSLGETQE